MKKIPFISKQQIEEIRNTEHIPRHFIFMMRKVSVRMSRHCRRHLRGIRVTGNILR